MKADLYVALQAQQQQGLGSLERRVLNVNNQRVKVVKPASKTSFSSTEIRGTYAPPFHVSFLPFSVTIVLIVGLGSFVYSFQERKSRRIMKELELFGRILRKV